MDILNGFSPAGELLLFLYRRIYITAATKIVIYASGTAMQMAIMALVGSLFDMEFAKTEEEVV